ncbi:MAG: YeeE/YedE family protein [Gammaproteobacteria bacterium]|nr:MAG: YeeE/YedE family protein [Gammaproteobacteria bacterium]
MQLRAEITESMQKNKSDRGVVLFTVLAILGLSLFLQFAFSLKQAVLFLTGVGLGISLLHAAFGFSSVWRNFIRKREGVGIRAQLLLFMLASLLFFPILGQFFPEISVAAALGPVGISVMMGAFLFGIGMELGNGCGSGTLWTVGGGHVNMLVTLAFFIVGSVIGTAHLRWWLELPSLGKISLIDSFGWQPALLLQLGLLLALYLFVHFLEKRRHGWVTPVNSRKEKGDFLNRLIFGPWPLIWGVAGLLFFSLVTLLVAGHPWSITFAFGLWGVKIWTALGGDISTLSYWSSGYPARALASSVLADVTSVMNFGIILGAMLAAGLAGSFAPAKKIQANMIISAVIGGLLLGYGARLAFGCNIGGLYSGIASGSLHGWLWLVAGFTGTIAGVYIRSLTGIDRPLRTQT